MDTYAKVSESHQRDSAAIPIEMLSEYDALSRYEQHQINALLADWLSSSDETLRFDAEFIISQRVITDAIPAIRAAYERLKDSSGPSAFYESLKLERILSELTCQKKHSGATDPLNQSCHGDSC